MLKDLLINNQKVVEEVSDFLEREFRKRKKKQAIVGISGGVDSAIAAILCQRAGLDLRAIFMPYSKFSRKELVEELVNFLDLSSDHFWEIDITQAVNFQIKLIEEKTGILLGKLDKGNIMTRYRMAIRYALARKLNGLVVGAQNLSEWYLGYFTLHGDKAFDLNPLGGLFKTQVVELAKYLRIPKQILDNPPSAELYENQTDERELGFSYQNADSILYLSFIKKLTPERIIEDFGFDSDLVSRVLERVSATQYKRQEVPRYAIY